MDKLTPTLYNEQIPNMLQDKRTSGEIEQEILIITIDLGGGVTDRISVYSSSEPSTLARCFCERNSLDAIVESALTRQIEFQINKLIDERVGLPTKVYRLAELKDQNSQTQISSLSEETPASFIQVQRGARRSATPTKSHLEGINDRLYYQGMRRQARSNRKIRNMKFHEEYTQFKEATFKPRINDRSSKTIVEDRFLHLYKDAEQRRRKISAKSARFLKEKCPFTPNTEVTAHVNQVLNRNRDLREIDKQSIYSESTRSDKRFKNLFEALNPTHSCISRTNIKTSALNPNLKALVLPVCKDDSEIIDHFTFSERLDRMLKKMNKTDQHCIIFFRKTQKPATSDSLYYKSLHQKRALAEKLEVERLKNVSKEMQECTFKPNINVFENNIF